MMAVKTVAVIIDDFSHRSLTYPNIHYYDFGTEITYAAYDDYYIDRTYNIYNTQFTEYGNIDGSITYSENT